MPKKTDQVSAKPSAASASPCSEHDDSAGVSAHVTKMTYSLKPTLEAVRRTILAADPAITEGIKWNSPSFYCHGWFATYRQRRHQRSRWPAYGHRRTGRFYLSRLMLISNRD